MPVIAKQKTPNTVKTTNNKQEAALSFRFERFMALRYLRSAQGRAEGRRFIRFITYVAVGGVAVGVAALLLALSVVRGFSREIEAKIIGFGAHIQVESYADEPLQDATALLAELAALPGVTHVAPVVQEFALLRHSATEIEGVALWGTAALPPYIAAHLLAGAPALAADTSGLPTVVIGQALAELMDVAIGDRVTAFSMRQQEGGPAIGGLPGGLQRPRVKQFVVSGIYETSLSNFDELYAFVDIDVARSLLGYTPEEVTRVDLTLADVSAARPLALQIEDRFGFPTIARTIFEVFRGLFAWVNLQESIIPVVISVIILVGAFNIIGTLLMLILEKTREIGILESMGASPRVMRRLFLWLGLLIGVAGTAIGELLALALAFLQQRYNLIPLPEEAYYMKTAPIALNPLDFLLVGVFALALCVTAAYIPARVAARIEPIRAIRFR